LFQKEIEVGSVMTPVSLCWLLLEDDEDEPAVLLELEALLVAVLLDEGLLLDELEADSLFDEDEDEAVLPPPQLASTSPAMTGNRSKIFLDSILISFFSFFIHIVSS